MIKQLTDAAGKGLSWMLAAVIAVALVGGAIAAIAYGGVQGGEVVAVLIALGLLWSISSKLGTIVELLEEKSASV
jgi:hypothetical protein